MAYHGRSFAPAWEELRGRPVEEVAQLVALNTMAAGNTLRSLSSEDGRAEVLVEGWPDEALLGFLPLDRDDCDGYGHLQAHHGAPGPQLCLAASG